MKYIMCYLAQSRVNKRLFTFGKLLVAFNVIATNVNTKVMFLVHVSVPLLYNFVNHFIGPPRCESSYASFLIQ